MAVWHKKKNLLRPSKYILELPTQSWMLLYGAASECSNQLMAYVRSARSDDELAEITGMSGGHTVTPRDPAIARLLPDIQHEDDEGFEGANGLWRALNEIDMAKEKLQDCVFLNNLCQEGMEEGSIAIEENEVDSFLRALTSTRLFLGMRLEHSREDREGERWQGANEINEFFGFLMQDLLEVAYGES
ncbi:MAG: DUF2017 family protein [Corynebacterium sp.]|nr:DUF2017 family protein [Corynebacterium sp.]